MTWSTRSAAVCAVRRAPHDAQIYPDPIVTLSAMLFVSMTQGIKMVTSGPNPDVNSARVPDAGNRISRKSNSSFDVTGGDPQ